MKILQVCPLFPPIPEEFGSGVINVVYNLSKELVKRGHDVSVYTSAALSIKNRLEIKNPKIIDGIKVYYFPYIYNYYTFFITPPIIPAINKNISSFDMIHLHDIRCFQSMAIYYFAKKYGVPYVLHTHGSYPQMIGEKMIKKGLDMAVGYRIMREAHKVIVLNNTEANKLRSLGIKKEKIAIIPNGVDLLAYRNIKAKKNFNLKYGIKLDEEIILYIGRLHESKGLDLLIRTFKKISIKRDNIKLVLMGPDDGYMDYLNILIERLGIRDKVIITGHVSNEEKKIVLANADVFVTPRYYGLPITFLEACACGIPIVVTNNGDDLDWIHNKVGYSVDYNEEQFGGAVIKILSETNLKNSFGEEGKKIVREKFNWVKSTEDIEDIYESCLK